MTRGSSFLDSSLRLEGICHIILLTLETKSYTNLWKHSQIKYKGSFLKYLRYCLEKGYVERHTIPPRRKRGQEKIDYTATLKGRLFLNIS